MNIEMKFFINSNIVELLSALNKFVRQFLMVFHQSFKSLEPRSTRTNIETLNADILRM